MSHKKVKQLLAKAIERQNTKVQHGTITGQVISGVTFTDVPKKAVPTIHYYNGELKQFCNHRNERNKHV